MGLEFSTSIGIAAPPERVWGILVDVAAWPAWNTTVTKVDGAVAPEATVTVHTRASPDRAFPVRVTALEAPRRMVWTGGMPLGLFKGERTYTIEPTASGVTFRMVEVYSGLLSGLVVRTIPDLQPAFEEFARCLRAEAEKPAA